MSDASRSAVRHAASAATEEAPRLGWLLLLSALVVYAALQALGAGGAKPAAAADPPMSQITVAPQDLASGNALGQFTYIVNVDNAHLGNATRVDDRPFRAPTESFSAIAAEGDQGRATVNLPSNCAGKANVALDGQGCRYLISVRSADHKMWGKHITLPGDAGTVGIKLSEASTAHPLPTGKLRVYVFNDNAWTNLAPDAEEINPGLGMGGFHVTLTEQTNSAVTADYHNRPLCSAASGSITGTPGDCTTQDDGFIEIRDLSPATYNVSVTPPKGPCDSDPDSEWRQTTTIDGGFPQLAGVEEGSDGTGAPGEQLFAPPNRRTGYFYGFVCVPIPLDAAHTGGGSISGRAVNWQGWPPFDTLIMDENHPVDRPFVALTDAGTDTTVWTGRGDTDGNFTVPNVAAGDYQLSIWDEQLTYIMRFVPVTVGPNEDVDLKDVGVSRWFGWLDGTTYKDLNGNGRYDAGTDQALANTDMDQRWNDGSIKEETFTDSKGHYEYPTAEGGALGKWFVNEQGFARFSAFPGPSVHDEVTPSNVLPSCSASGTPAAVGNAAAFGGLTCMPTDLGGGLLTNQLVSEGHQATVDWGKTDYPTGTPGQIVGITYFATTRNEFDARLSAHENYEPAIPDVTVRLEDAAELGADKIAGTADDPPWDPKYIVNEYVTDKWHKPSAEPAPFTQNCNPIIGITGTDADGNPTYGDTTDQFNPAIGNHCLEVPITGEPTKDGAFDGGYAFADYCPNGFDEHAPNPDDAPCWNAAHDDHVAPDPLRAGKYVTHVLMPQDSGDSRTCNRSDSTIGKQVSDTVGTAAASDTTIQNQQGCLYRVEREEDVNVDLGAQFTPAIPPPPCAGDMHKLDQATLTSRSTFWTKGDQSASPERPLCDMHYIDLQNQQNVNADFFLETNFPDTVQHLDIAPGHPDPVGGVEEPGRAFGGVFDDIYFDADQNSVWYGEPRPIGNIPVGIYGVDAPGDGPQNWRLMTTVTTDNEGAYEALLPSTETFNCPIPQGPCPGMYLFVVNDPGSKAHPNANYNPDYLTATTAYDVWPGQTDLALDTPLDPISGTACSQSRVDSTGNLTSTKPELLRAAKQTDTTVAAASRAFGPFVRAADTGTNRRIVIDADFIGPPGATGATGGHVNLTDERTGVVTTLTRANGGIVSWTPGDATTADRVVIQVPALSAAFTAGPKQLDIVTSTTNTGGALTTSNGITLHVLGGSGTTAYNPAAVVQVPAPTVTGHELQNAIDAAPANSLLILGQGNYRENVVMWRPLKLQGVGPGGIIGAHELLQKQPDDPRFKVGGSIVDGSYFRENAAARQAVVGSHAPYAGIDGTNPVIDGGDITVLAQSNTAYGSGFDSARIDGIGLQYGQTDTALAGQNGGAGGIEAQAYANNLRITNNVLVGNAGPIAGGIALGKPYVLNASGDPIADGSSHNANVRITNNRMLGNGGIARSGALGIFGGSNNYTVAKNYICGNFGVEYGAGISHWGFSPGGSISDNEILYNDAVDSGAGLAINDQTPAGTATDLGQGSGPVNVDRNLIQGNYSNDDGGGVFIQNALTSEVNLRNNLIVNNGAADMGGGISLDDSSNVRIVNDTVANNVSTGSFEGFRPVDQGGTPHAAGLASEANDPRFTGHGNFSRPAALFNDIFWNNEAFLLSTAGPGATLISQGFVDFEVHDTHSASDAFTPRFSTLTPGNTSINGNGGQVAPPSGAGTAGQGNLTTDPLFADPFTLELAVAGSRLDPQMPSVTITGQDPADGVPGNYHLQTALAADLASGAVDRGVRCSNATVPPPVNPVAACTGGGISAPILTNADIDGQARPQLRSLRARTPWDTGADEVPLVP